MSDRVAVFNNCRIEQVGAPAEVYERPTTAFVAGFVGVSNLIDGATAQALTGRAESFAIRPEKIRILEASAPAPAGMCMALGSIRDVIYLGMHTRYLVELEAGGDLTVVEQNLETSSLDVAGSRGRAVRLVWQPEHNRVVGGTSPGV
jgi:putative spermidine/putrescine transport system ATP-binding protein